jgi:dolichol-phosphate mannosyltransferase
MKVAVVIAAYNEGGNIGPLTERLIRALESLPQTTWNLIYVIEGTDGTVETARGYAQTRPEIEILYNRTPSGLGRAFRRGFDGVPPDADAVVTMDADLNHQPEEIPRLLDTLFESGADLVIGSRRVEASAVEGGPTWKALLSRVVNRIMQILMGVRVRDMTSGFRVYRGESLRRIEFQSTGFAFLPEMLIDAASQGFKIVEEPIRFIFREVGESKMSIPLTGLSYLKLFARHWLSSRKRPGTTGTVGPERRNAP